MRKSYRKGRLAEEIKKIISTLLQRELKDPRLAGIISITEVDASADGSFATVYISILGAPNQDKASDEEKENVLAAFASAKGLIRHEIGQTLQLRHTPDLAFKIDTSEEYGRHIEKLIDELEIPKDED